MNATRSARASLFVAALTLSALGCTVAGVPPTDPPAFTPAPVVTVPPGGGGGGTGGGGDTGMPGDPNAPIGGQPPADDPAPGDSALRVQPEPGIVDARPHAWDRITVAADGRTITVYYWGGIEDCYGLAGVDVQVADDGRPIIRVFEGRRGDLPPDTACIEIALLKAVEVDLEEPIVAPSQ